MGEGLGRELGAVIKGQQGDPCGVGTVQYLDCGGRSTDLHRW